MFDKLWEYRKAIVAGVLGFIAFLAPSAVIDDGLVWSEVLGALLAGATAAGVTWGIPNKNYVHKDKIELEP